MANTILTPQAVTREALRVLINNLVFAKTINRQYDDQFAQSGAKIGDSLKIRLPNRYTVRTGATLNAQDTTETSVTLQVATQIGVDVNFTSSELTMSLDDFSKRVLEPAMATLANKVDLDGLALYQDVYNSTGIPGTTPATAAAILAVGEKLDDSSCPRDTHRHLTINPAANAALVDGLKGLFHAGSSISEQFRKGQMGADVLGFATIGMDQNVAQHTNGTQGGIPLVNGPTQTGGSLVTDGWSAGATITRGTVFTLAGVFGVNPQSRVSTGKLQQFVVAANATADGSGNATLAISPSIVTSGAAQTVTGSPADNASLSLVGSASTSYPQNLGYHRDAFTLATADLVMPKGVDFAAREIHEGISMRIVRQYDINNDKFPCRIDILYGWKTIRPELACRLIG